jgi:hypothetical protein
MAIRARARGLDAKKAGVWEGPGWGPNLGRSRIPWGRAGQSTATHSPSTLRFTATARAGPWPSHAVRIAARPRRGSYRDLTEFGIATTRLRDAHRNPLGR